MHIIHWSNLSTLNCRNLKYSNMIITKLLPLSLLHYLHVQYLSIMFDIFIMALALMYDHVFIVQKLLLYFERLLSMSLSVHLHVQHLSIMFDIFIIALALLMYDHALSVQKLL